MKSSQVLRMPSGICTAAAGPLVAARKDEDPGPLWTIAAPIAMASNLIRNLIAIASNLKAMASNLMASNLRAMASMIAMASNLMAFSLMGMASNLISSNLIAMASNVRAMASYLI